MDENIMLWGPSNSGKTMLIWGFARDIEQYSEADNRFGYSLHQLFQLNPIVEPIRKLVIDIIRQEKKFPEGSQFLSDKTFEFRRIPKQNCGLSKNQIRQHSFTHLINIRDLSGGDSVSFINDSSMLEVRQAYINSRNIIATFDISFGSDGDSGKMISDFQQLIQFLTENHPDENKKRNLAICLTKVDKHKLNPLSKPREIISMIYGPSLLRFIDQEKLSNSHINIELFATSSVGMYFDNKDFALKANVNHENDYFFKNGEQWCPIQAAAPFFWIFESIEKEKFKQTGIKQKDYLPYN